MPPPQQSFCTYHSPIVDAKLGLKVEDKFLIRESTSQLHPDFSARLSVSAHHWQKKPIRASSSGFCVVERQVGIRYQLVDARTVSRCNRNPGAGANKQL